MIRRKRYSHHSLGDILFLSGCLRDFSLVFSSLTPMCGFLCLSYLEFTGLLESVNLCLSPNLVNFGYFFKFFWSCFLFSFWDAF